MSSSFSRSSSAALRRARAGAGSARASRCPRGTGCTCRRTRARRSRSSAGRRAPRTWSRRRSAARGCRASSPAAATDSKSSGTSRCSSVKIGVEEPPGVQNFSFLLRVAHAAGHVEQLAQRDAERRLVLAGPLDVSGQAEDAEAVDFSVPMPVNHSAPLSRIEGTEAMDSTLLTDRRPGVEPGDRGERRLERAVVRDGPRGCRAAPSPRRRCRRRRRRAP